MKAKKILIAGGITILVFIFLWYWFRPDPQEEITPKEKVMSEDLKNCYLLASATYFKNWDRACTKKGLDFNCEIPEEEMQKYKEQEQETRKQCKLLYDS